VWRSFWNRGSERKEAKYGLALMAAKSRQPEFESFLHLGQSFSLSPFPGIGSGQPVVVDRLFGFTVLQQAGDGGVIVALGQSKLVPLPKIPVRRAWNSASRSKDLLASS